MILDKFLNLEGTSIQGYLHLENTGIVGSSGLGMVRYGGINRLNPYLARDLIG